MRRYVITGAPGSGKTSIVEELKGRGYPVVAEAATDVIARAHARGVDEPWTDPGFIDAIVAVQRERQRVAAPSATVQVFDRSPICTLALARYLGHPVTATVTAEIDRIAREGVYQRQVFFVRPLGFITPTAARRITLEQSLEFERVHEQEYRAHGYEIVDIPPASVAERATLVEKYVEKYVGEPRHPS